MALKLAYSFTVQPLNIFTGKMAVCEFVMPVKVALYFRRPAAISGNGGDLFQIEFWACKPQPIFLIFGNRNNKCLNFIKQTITRYERF